MSTEQKVQEGLQLLKQADKLTQKTLTRWKADWEGAALLYEQAATSFKNARAFEQAKQAFEKASGAQYRSQLVQSAARLLESAAAMAREQRQAAEAATLLERAAALHSEHGAPAETAADCLIRAAKAVEQDDEQRATSLSRQACELFEIDGSSSRAQFAVAPFKYAISLHLRRPQQQHEAAVELTERLCAVLKRLNNTHELHKQALSMVVLLLHADDPVAADRRYQQFAAEEPEFGGSAEGRLAFELLTAFEHNDQQALQQLTQRQTLTFLDNQLARLAKSLRLPAAACAPGSDSGSLA
eukprot:TRINITY_DN4712_c0_g1_i2.p1 TRINITY_DN4712_c0_g1~~TRINITY_DN4712_c0_g1_i2.p1  ORF type:complete len:299 (+),score=149.20 TRINITY_DN4712_c0_g1_i2:110-1006(+)